MAPLADASLVDRLTTTVVGRRRELEVVVAALAAGRHILLEGPPGTGKSTLLRAVAVELGIGFEFVEGNAELTPARLVGHFDPSLVMSEGYSPDVFVDGPLAAAMRDGSLLYVEEINRIPEETLNVLITVMSERELNVPRYGRIAAAPGFRLVAAMNPFDAIGTARISSAVYDRVCRLAEDEEQIVRRDATEGVASDWLAKVVELVRRTRAHHELRVGSSVRGAIDCVAVTAALANVRGVTLTDAEVGLDAALVALSGRVRVREGVARTSEVIITELWHELFDPPEAGDDSGKGHGATTPAPATH